MGWIILGVIIAIIIDAIIADEMKTIAEHKGYPNAGHYFWISFLLGLPGWLVVIALPNRNVELLLQQLVGNNGAAPQNMGAAPAMAPSAGGHIPGRVPGQYAPPAPPYAPPVQQPTAPVPPQVVVPVAAPADDMIQCPACGLTQKADRRVCWKCGAKFETYF